MSSLKHKIAAEMKVRQLLAAGEVPAPDAVEYGYQCIRLFWQQPRVVLVIDLEDDGDGSLAAGASGTVDAGDQDSGGRTQGARASGEDFRPRAGDEDLGLRPARGDEDLGLRPARGDDDLGEAA